MGLLQVLFFFFFFFFFSFLFFCICFFLLVPVVKARREYIDRHDRRWSWSSKGDVMRNAKWLESILDGRAERGKDEERQLIALSLRDEASQLVSSLLTGRRICWICFSRSAGAGLVKVKSKDEDGTVVDGERMCKLEAAVDGRDERED